MYPVESRNIMRDIRGKIEMVQTWVDDLRRSHTDGPGIDSNTEALLDQVLRLLDPPHQVISTETGSPGQDAVLAQRVQEQVELLDHAVQALQQQIMHQQGDSRTLRRAFTKLQESLLSCRIVQTQLNHYIQAELADQRQIRALEKEERALTEALRDTLATMSNMLNLDKILDHILDAVDRVTPYDAANIMLIESDMVHFARQKGYVAKELEREFLAQRIPLTKLAILRQLIDLGNPVVIPDTSDSDKWIGLPGLPWINSNIVVPIRTNGKILGFLSLDSATRGYFNQDHAYLLQSFADQAAIAIQNARLLDRAKRTAVMAERSRLANELHDTISQTLWSMSLITERLPAIWEIDREKGHQSLITLHQLAQNALSEMRSLLLELHPSFLADAKFGDLIRQAVEVIANRTGLRISIKLGNQDPIPTDVKFALYRVLQEALNNTALHALAQNVQVQFDSLKGAVKLTIQDDGRGFNPETVESGHLGIRIMHDRMHNVDGSFELVSRPGEPTLISAVWFSSDAQKP